MRDHVKGGALTEVTFFILLSLYTPKHGYAIMQFVEEETNGRLSLGAGTLYGALNTLQEKGANRDFSFIIKQNGMFSFSGLNKDQVETLKKEHGIYIVGSGRICVAGINQRNVDALAKAIAAVVKA